ncbi:MAG TPA: hypothetical protein VEC06_10710 [Paucimonas sp.]|nr:hypothetical protein [Paucimonas sp.]
MRRFLCILLLVLAPLHGFAMQSGWYAEGNAFDLAHEIDHLTGATHHHGDDHGDVHYDDSSDSAKHFAEHSASNQCAALPSAMMPPFAVAASRATIPEPQHYIPDPFPERLQRPPSFAG